MSKCICAIALLLAFFLAAPAHAVTLFVSPDGENGFILEGDNIGDAQVVEVSLDYDPSVLANPQVNMQGGTITDLYDGTPGTLLFSVDRGENHAATFEAHLSFVRKGNCPGGINSVTGVTGDVQGKSSPALSSMNLSLPQKEKDASSDPEGEPTSPSAAAGNEESETAATADELAAPPKSVLQRFEEYKGKRGLKEFAALFEPRGREMTVQEPPIALSDGKTPLSVTLQLPSAGGEAPDVVLSDTKLVSVLKGEGAIWSVTLLPNEGTAQASLMLRRKGELVEFPLVVAAPVGMPDGMKENNFLAALQSYLVEKGGGRGAKSILQESLYEYTFTANYLAHLAKGESKAVPR